MKRLSLKVLLSLSLAIFLVTPMSLAHAATQSSISRSDAETRALSMINLQWNYNSNKNGVIDSKYSGSVSMPSQFKNITSAEVTGIPYNWGGIDSLDSNSYNAPWVNFTDAINKGAYAGNVNTSAGYGYIPRTAGIDCSGFVQAVFNIKDYKLSTSTLFNNYFTKISISDLKHMDILDKPNDHVVVFDSWGTQNGVSGAFTYESTPDQTYGGIQGAKKYFISMNVINSGYLAGRYVNITDDSISTALPTVTPVNTVTQVSLPKPAEPGVFAQITNVNYYANVRSNCSMDSSILGTIPKGTIVYLIDYSSGWYQISFNGKVGYIYGTLVSNEVPSGKFVTVSNASTLNIRALPSSSAAVVGYLYKNQYAEVTGYSSNGNWIKININGLEGYCYGSYLSYIH